MSKVTKEHLRGEEVALNCVSLICPCLRVVALISEHANTLDIHGN